MLLERLWMALRFVQWEDTISFHARLFRCFLLGLLDAHTELAFLSQGSERMLAVLGQRLADVGLMHHAGHLHEPVSHQASPLGRRNNATIRCPPRRRYEATSLPVPPPFVSQPINITHGLYDEPAHSAVAFDLPGSGPLLGGYGGPLVGVVGCILLWLFILAIVVSCSSSTARARSDSTRTMCRPQRVAVDSTTNSGERVIGPLPQDHLAINEATQGLVAGTPEGIGHRASMPGAWFHERREQSIPDESVPDTMSWMLFCSCARMGMKAWAHFPALTSIFSASDHLNLGSKGVVTIGRKSEDGSSSVRQGLGLNDFNLDAGVSTIAAFNGTEEQGAAQDCLPSQSGLSIGNFRGSATAMHNRRRELSAIGDVAIKDPDCAQITTLDVVHGDKIGLTFALVASSNVDRVLCHEDVSSDADGSANGDEESFGIGTQPADISSSEKKDEYRVLGRRQGGALSDTGCPLLLRRARSIEYLWKKRDIFNDDDEETGDDSYWTEQVNARLSGERDSRRYGWSDVSSWPREGREDETNNWRTRSSQDTDFAAPEKTSEAMQCQANSTKLRRYSSPPLNLNASLSHRAGSEDGPQGIYVVPQKRGRTTSGRCWSPVSSPRPSDRPGFGFFPFRRTPSLLTPEAWRPGCLYIPDPPVDESSRADTWWDSLTSISGCGTASAAGHLFSTGTMIQDAPEQGPPFSRDPQDAPVSWRDKYENDPASRRFIAVHRRAMTEG